MIGKLVAAAAVLARLVRARRPLGTWQVTSKFGPRTHPVTGKETFHHGLDLRAPKGTVVVAPFDGLVSAGEGENAGLFVTLSTVGDVAPFGGPVKVSFMHLSKVVRTGAVSAGDVIALTGDSGRVTGPHLHLEVRTADGVTHDPQRCFS